MLSLEEAKAIWDAAPTVYPAGFFDPTPEFDEEAAWEAKGRTVFWRNR